MKKIFGVYLLVFTALFSPFSLAQAQDAGGEYVDSISLALPEASVITDVVTDGYTGTVYYKAPGSLQKSLILEPPPVWGTLPSGDVFPLVNPMAVIVNENTSGLTQWQGGYYVGPGAASLYVLKSKTVQEFTATRRETYTSSLAQFGVIHQASQWIVRAKLVEDKTANGGNGGTQTPEPKKIPATRTFEGTVVQIGGPYGALHETDKNWLIAVGQEAWNNIAAKVEADKTSITLNGVTVDLTVLQSGDKVKIAYDPVTGIAWQVKAER